MRHFTISALIITLVLTGLSLLTTGIPPSPSNHALAASGSPKHCIKKKPANCTRPTSPSNPGGGGGGGVGAAGSNTPADQAACEGLSQLGGTQCGNGAGQNAVGSVANRVVKIISYIAGIAAIIMIIISGVRYTTSGGDSARVGAAKTALVYALIGVAVVALTQFLIHFVLTTTNV